MLQSYLKARTKNVPRCLTLRALIVPHSLCRVKSPYLEPYGDSSHYVFPSGKRDNACCHSVSWFRGMASFHYRTLRNPDWLLQRRTLNILRAKEFMARTTAATFSTVLGPCLPFQVFWCDERAYKEARLSMFVVQLHRLHVVRRSQLSQHIAKTAAYSTM